VEGYSLHITGYKYDEIAQKLTLPLGTVKSRIHTARERLKKQLER
jgi:RNA polymerase sigma-70 factor (ECF subfamily)